MFGNDSRDELKRLTNFNLKTKVRQMSTKRGAGYLPPPPEGASIESYQSRHGNLQSLFVSLVASERTCGIIISSAKLRSRTNLILVRGRLIACLRGQRNNKDYTSGAAALEQVKMDLRNANCKYCIYPLSEAIVLAASSAFHGLQKHKQESDNSHAFLLKAFNDIVNSKHPGCIMLKNSQNHTSAMLYFFNGKLIGTYANERGWLENNIEIAQLLVAQEKDAHLSAYMLQARNMNEVHALTTTLYGTIEESQQSAEFTASSNLDRKLSAKNQSTKISLRNTLKLDVWAEQYKQQEAIAKVASYALRSNAVTPHAHLVNP